MAVRRDIPKWQLPKSREDPSYREKKALAVFFLCLLNDSEIGEVCQRIFVIDESWTERPDGELRPVVPVPWIHSQTPPLSTIFDIRGSIFIDEESMRTDTAIVVQSAGDPESKVARVRLGRVNLITQSLMSREIPFSELVAPNAVISIEQPQADPCEPAAQQSPELVHALPHHLPEYLKMEPLKLTLISLVYLSEHETTRLKATVTMSEQISDVIIYNWPDEENPCSREDLYRLFSQLELDIHADCDETFALFIDRKCDGSYQILRAHKYIRRNKQGVIKDFDEQFIDLRDLKEPRLAAYFWHIMWNPWADGKKGTSYNGFRVNSTLFNSRNALYGNYEEIVPNPDKLVLGNYDPIFVLSPMADADLRLIRSYIMREAENEFCLYDVSKKLKSPDIRSLMQCFNESTEPPTYFMAVDSTSLEIARSAMSRVQSLKRGKIDVSRALLVASDEPIHVVFSDDEGYNSYAEVRLGYAYARQSVSDAFSTCTNLSFANMNFHECVEIENVETWEYVDEWLKSNPVIDEDDFGSAIIHLSAFRGTKYRTFGKSPSVAIESAKSSNRDDYREWQERYEDLKEGYDEEWSDEQKRDHLENMKPHNDQYRNCKNEKKYVKNGAMMVMKGTTIAPKSSEVSQLLGNAIAHAEVTYEYQTESMQDMNADVRRELEQENNERWGHYGYQENDSGSEQGETSDMDIVSD